MIFTVSNVNCEFPLATGGGDARWWFRILIFLFSYIHMDMGLIISTHMMSNDESSNVLNRNYYVAEIIRLVHAQGHNHDLMVTGNRMSKCSKYDYSITKPHQISSDELYNAMIRRNTLTSRMKF